MECSDCDNGARVSYDTNKNRFELQRCDNCRKFKSDSEAWKSLNPDR